METKVIIQVSDVETAKEIIEEFVNLEKEHSNEHTECTLSLEIEIS